MARPRKLDMTQLMPTVALCSTLTSRTRCCEPEPIVSRIFFPLDRPHLPLNRGRLPLQYSVPATEVIDALNVFKEEVRIYAL